MEQSGPETNGTQTLTRNQCRTLGRAKWIFFVWDRFSHPCARLRVLPKPLSLGSAPAHALFESFVAIVTTVSKAIDTFASIR